MTLPTDTTRCLVLTHARLDGEQPWAKKPRIRYRYGVWSCGLVARSVMFPPYGHGYTPSDAFKDWKAQTEVAASTATT